MKRARDIVATLAGLLAAAAATGQVALAEEFAFTLPDASGATVTIPAPPRRIISLAPSITEILFALGLDRMIVGISDADDYPPDRVQTKERVGGVLINLERVVSLKPDLVIGIPSLQRDQLARLRTLRLPVLAVDATSIEETTAQIRMLGRVTGRLREAEDLALSIERRAQVVRPGPRRTLYIEVWNEPVLVAGGNTLVHDLVRRAGGANIFSDLRGYAQVPQESILTRNPQVILLLYPGRDRLMTRPGWRGTAAVRNGFVYELPPSLVTRPGPRIADGLALVARLLANAR